MEFRSSVVPYIPQTVSAILASRERSDRLVFITIFTGVLCLMPILIIGSVAIGLGLVLAILAILIMAVIIMRWPIVGFFLLLGCTLLIEQSPLSVLGNAPLIYIFYWPPSLEGLPDRPIGFAILFVLLVQIIHGLLKRQKPLQGGQLLVPYLLLLLCVVWGIFHGLTSGGELKITVNEVRSFWYLFVGYLLAYNLIRTKKHLRAIFWFVIICAGIKALEGVYIYAFVIHGDLADHHEIMAHEESYFWISALLLVMLFSLYYRYRPQFYTALALVPFLLIALVANNRRADFAALLVGAVVAWVLIFIIKPQARSFLVVALVVTVVLGGAYVAAFYKGQGGFSSPARSIVSVVYPDANQAASNLYRDIENFDLKYTVKLNPMGLGFGKPFLQPQLLPNISDTDPVYNLIPHNTIYWVWMRLGPLGYLALWYLFGTIVVRGCIYARQLKDRYLKLAAVYIVCMIIMEVMVAYADYQLSFYRNVLYIGILAGVLMRLPALDESREDVDNSDKATNGRRKKDIISI